MPPAKIEFVKKWTVVYSLLSVQMPGASTRGLRIKVIKYGLEKNVSQLK